MQVQLSQFTGKERHAATAARVAASKAISETNQDTA
jgi:hypothetical protein